MPTRGRNALEPAQFLDHLIVLRRNSTHREYYREYWGAGPASEIDEAGKAILGQD
jgi:hypothetical protein